MLQHVTICKYILTSKGIDSISEKSYSHKLLHNKILSSNSLANECLENNLPRHKIPVVQKKTNGTILLTTGITVTRLNTKIHCKLVRLVRLRYNTFTLLHI